MPTTLQLLPPAFKRVFCAYKWLGTMTEPAASTGYIQQFRLNSLYDPDYTGVGSAAIGYASLTSMYSLFRVVRARAIVRFAMSTSGTASVGMLPGLNPTVTSTFNYLEAEPNSVSAMIQGNTGGGHSIATFNRVFDLPKVCGVTPTQYNTDFDFAHSTGSNPGKSVYLTVFLAGNSGTAQAVIVNVRLVFEVEVSQPLQSLTG